MKILEIATDRSKEVNAWIARLSAAERQAKAKPEAKQRLYQISYRVDQRESAKGKEGVRRSALVKLIDSMTPFDEHLSTSTWLVRSYIEKAVDLANLLTPPLDSRVDFLSVAQISANRTIFGDAKLKS